MYINVIITYENADTQKMEILKINQKKNWYLQMDL